MHPVRIGTCGWLHPEWSGDFYPKELPSSEFLAFFAERFPIVEVDSTFYGSPSRRMVEDWRDKTPDSFGFSLKVPQIITHKKVLLDCQQELDAFLSAARLLGDKLLCCLLQFGYFNKEAFASLDAFLERLDPFLTAWPGDIPVAVEVRNKNWFTSELAGCLRKHRAVWALADEAWAPSRLSLVRDLDTVTGSFAYFRLLGERAEVDKLTETLGVVLNQDNQLETNAQAIKLVSERVPVLAFVNNNFGCSTPELPLLLATMVRSSDP